METNEKAVALRIEGLTKIFHLGRHKDVTALDNLSLEIKEGEIFGLLGPNGSGKTTALKLILGLLFPTSGQIEILGRNYQEIEVRNDIGYLPENPYYYRYLTGPEILTFYGRIFGMTKETIEEKKEKLLKLVGLYDKQHLSLKHFSKGMLERIGLAVAMLNDPKFLILDEPTTGLDPIGSRETRNLLLDLQAAGKTILLSSHYLSEIEKVSSRVGILHRGKLLALGTISELMTQRKAENIEDLFIKVIEWSTKQS
ncbi:MAG: ABC transporter ATP-binding protein [Candidatus Omnitrophota bacterium]